MLLGERSASPGIKIGTDLKPILVHAPDALVACRRQTFPCAAVPKQETIEQIPHELEEVEEVVEASHLDPATSIVNRLEAVALPAEPLTDKLIAGHAVHVAIAGLNDSTFTNTHARCLVISDYWIPSAWHKDL
jgi:hypothetical protein